MSYTRTWKLSVIPQAAARQAPSGLKATTEQPCAADGRVQYTSFGSWHACSTFFQSGCCKGVGDDEAFPG